MLMKKEAQDFLGNGHLRVFEDDSFIIYGDEGTWALRGEPGILEVGQAQCYRNLQENRCLDWRILASDPSQILSNGTFRPTGAMTAVDVSTDDDRWERVSEGLEKLESNAERSGQVSLKKLMNAGNCVAMYSGDSGRRVIIERGHMPAPEKMVAKWYDYDKHGKGTLRVFLLNGKQIRFAQLMGIDMFIPSGHTSSLDQKMPLPWAHGFGKYEGKEISFCFSAMVGSDGIESTRDGRFLHTHASICSWMKVEQAVEILGNSPLIYSPDNSYPLHIVNSDLQLERKLLKLGNSWFYDYCKESIALDCLRWNGWSEKDIEDYLNSRVMEVWFNNIKEQITSLRKAFEDYRSLNDYDSGIHLRNTIEQTERKVLKYLPKMDGSDMIIAAMDEIQYIKEMAYE